MIDNELEAFDLQEQVSKICKEQLTPALDELFSRFVSTDEIIAIEKIEIDLGKIRTKDLEKELVGKIIQALEKQIPIQLLPNAQGTTKISVPQNQFQMWLEFLERGTLPWQASQLDEKKWLESVLSSVAANVVSKGELRLVLQKNPQAVRRLILQYPVSFLEKLVRANVGTVPMGIAKVYDELEVVVFSFTKKDWIRVKGNSNKMHFFPKRNFKQIFWEEMIKHYLIKNVSGEKEEKIIENVFTKIVSKKEISDFVNVLLEKTEKISATSSLEIKSVLKKIQKQISIAPSLKDKKQGKPSSQSKEDSQRENFKNKKNKTIELQKSKLDKNERTSLLGKKNIKTEKELKEADFIEKNNLQESSEIDFEKIPEGTAYYIAYAGIVMTHPFLSRFFQKLELLEDSKFKDETARQRAIHLVHFLASGKTQIPEYELLLPKFLCGLSFEIPIEREVILTAAEKAECDNLLQTMISHWGALGSTTPDGLREGFLQRAGKLEKRANGWFLLVEGKTIDMLLGQLPWNLSMIQLSWMKELLRVEWY